MKYVLAGGGTGGHINPALAIAGELEKRDPGAQFLFIGTETGMESELVPRAGYSIQFISAHGFSRSGGLRAAGKNLSYAARAYRSSIQAKKIIKTFGADIVIGTGGYVSGPVVYGAQMASIPSVVHEQNAFAGVTTRLVAKKAKRVFLSFPNTIGIPESAHTVLTGNPIRAEFTAADPKAARETLAVDDRPLILSCGGSLGARAMNEALLEVLELSQRDGLLNHIHATGALYKDRVFAALAKKGIAADGSQGITVLEYIHNMVDCMAACELVINRAGAITLAEIAALGKPSILIPSPNVSENHQYHNAAVLRDAGAAILIEEKDLTGQALYDAILSIVCDSRKRKSMSDAAQKLAHLNATAVICDEIAAVLAQAKKRKS